MVVVSLFEHSLKLEMAISELEEHNIKKDSILAKPVVKTPQEKKYLDPYNSDGLNFFIVSMFGMILMLLGAIYGFVLYLGPILCALIGLIIGATFGFIVDFYLKKAVRRKKLTKSIADVLLFINIQDEKAELVEEILRRHQALGLVRM